jgi:hypothetical protein
MKPIFLALAALLSLNVSAKSPIIEESYLVKNDSPELYDVIRTRPEFIIDHLKDGSFELYGPNGLGAFAVLISDGNYTMILGILHAGKDIWIIFHAL